MSVAQKVYAWSAQVAAAFTATPADRVAGLLETLVTLGQARGTQGGYNSG